MFDGVSFACFHYLSHTISVHSFSFNLLLPIFQWHRSFQQLTWNCRRFSSFTMHSRLIRSWNVLFFLLTLHFFTLNYSDGRLNLCNTSSTNEKAQNDRMYSTTFEHISTWAHEQKLRTQPYLRIDSIEMSLIELDTKLSCSFFEMIPHCWWLNIKGTAKITEFCHLWH